MTTRIITGDWVEMLRREPDESVHCCVTSPPYWGLRDYGVPGQLGLERTPEEYVAKMVEGFREVRRVLRKDGTLWLNLGDSYASQGGPEPAQTKWQVEGASDGQNGGKSRRAVSGLKPKDLVGIPWEIAKALRAPYYAGRVKSEGERIWLAATLDAEGTICGFRHQRKDDGRIRTGVHITITNSSTLMLDEAQRIWPASRSEHQRAYAGHLGRLDTFCWIVHGTDNKLLFLREIYPHLIVKKRQAVVAYNLLLLVQDAKRLGKGEQGVAVREKRDQLVKWMSDLNQQRPVDLPDWLIEPPSVLEPGWYLRQDIIWAKKNPMPESVRDRCTKSHEYLFLLTKSERYWFDNEAIKEPLVRPEELDRKTPAVFGGRDKWEGAHEHSRLHSGNEYKRKQPVAYKGSSFTDGKTAKPGVGQGERRELTTRNKRDVWFVGTQPYKAAHFATFPPKLIEPCILAGCPLDGTVLDPFNGAGTTGLVATRLGRNYTGIELKPEYIQMTWERLKVNPNEALPAQ